MRGASIYWSCIFAALFFCVLYNAATSKKYGIPRWKFLTVTLLAFGFNWGISYILAWIEAGFGAPETVNGVRAWLFAPFFFLACSFAFRIEPKRLTDAITPCYVLGFAIGKFGCIFGDCCYGYAYEGPLHIYNSALGYNVFPVQLLESVAALFLFIGFLVYVLKSDFRITGKQYPTMLVFYAGRFIFEYFRDNRKIWHGLSALSFHALADGIVGAVWLYFMTPAGKRTAVRIGNFFRRLFGKEQTPVLTAAGYAEQEKNRKKKAAHNVGLKNKPTKRECCSYLIGAVLVLFCCVLILTTTKEISNIMFGLVAYFAAISAALMGLCVVRLKRV